jgi:hypothetical protein
MTPQEALIKVQNIIDQTEWKANCPAEVCLMIEAKAKLIEFTRKINRLKIMQPVPVGDVEDE